MSETKTKIAGQSGAATRGDVGQDAKVEMVKAMLTGAGFPPERIEAAMNAILGKAPPERPERPEPVADDEPLLTPRELAQRLKISVTSLWRLNPPFIKVRGRKRYLWSAVKAFLEAGKCA